MKRLKATRDLDQFLKFQREEWNIEYSHQSIDDTRRLLDQLPDNMIQPEFFNKSHSTVPNVINVILNGSRFNVGYLEMLGGEIHIEKLDQDHYWWPGSAKTHEFTDAIPKCILDFVDDCCMRDERYVKEVVNSIPGKRKHRKEYAEFLKSIEHLSPEARMRAIFTRPLRRSLDYQGIARKFMVVEKLPEGTTPEGMSELPIIYDKDIK